MSSATLTVRLPADLKDRLARLAGATRRTSSFLAAEAIEAYVARELEIVEGIEKGLADVDAGRVIEHEVFMDELDAMLDRIERGEE